MTYLTIQITQGNAHSRIKKAIEQIVSSWEKWEGEAGMVAQVNQDPQAGIDEMYSQLGVVIEGMVFDRD